MAKEETNNSTPEGETKASASSSGYPLWQKALLVFVAVAIVVVVPVAITTSNNDTEERSINGGQGPIDTDDTIDSTSVPSAFPSSSPTGTPSNTPSSVPSAVPSDSPSLAPSAAPSAAPSSSPSSSPTELYVEPNRVPNNPERGYFNYDASDNTYGPSRWDRVDTSRHPLREFGPNGFGPWAGHLDYDPSENMCGRPDRRQSPKDLVTDIVCDAHHEIRTWCSPFSLSDTEITPVIWPHKLSFNMPRRPCIDMENDACYKDEPPVADYPRYSSAQTSYSDLINYDIKVPGEHTIDGETFDAEIQMLHIHPTDDRVSSIGVLVRASETGGHNEEFQVLLDEFQRVYDADLDECNSRRKGRNLGIWSWLTNNRREPTVRSRYVKFNPYSTALMPTIFFHRYDGSITEPPCKDITWWVMEKPVIISMAQLSHTKQLLFTHVDGDCQQTSVHNEDQSVARDVYPLGEDREIQNCREGSFLSDFDKGRGEGRKCRGVW